MRKKIIYSLSSLGAIATPIVSTISCTQGSKFTSSTSNLEEVGIVLTGELSRGSFNSNAWNAVQAIYWEIGERKASFSSDAIIEFADYEESIYEGIVNGYKIRNWKTIIAPSYLFSQFISRFNNEYPNQVGFIGVDYKSNAPNVASIVYNSQESSFEAGILAGYKMIDEKIDNPKFGLFGATDAIAITDFLTGFIKGINYFNDNLASEDKQKIKIINYEKDEDYTNSGFSDGLDSPSIVKTNYLMSNGANVILAASETQTAITLNAIKKYNADNGVTDNKTWLIASDRVFEKIIDDIDKPYVLTSIVKDISEGVRRVWTKLWDPNQEWDKSIKGFGETTYGTLENGLTSISHNIVSVSEDLFSKATTNIIKDKASDEIWIWKNDALPYIKKIKA